MAPHTTLEQIEPLPIEPHSIPIFEFACSEAAKVSLAQMLPVGSIQILNPSAEDRLFYRLTRFLSRYDYPSLTRHPLTPSPPLIIGEDGKVQIGPWRFYPGPKYQKRTPRPDSVFFDDHYHNSWQGLRDRMFDRLTRNFTGSGRGRQSSGSTAVDILSAEAVKSGFDLMRWEGNGDDIVGVEDKSEDEDGESYDIIGDDDASSDWMESRHRAMQFAREKVLMGEFLAEERIRPSSP
ncbi:hypothetical protein VTL71DRAFT_7393 [Oculimacula yallundae]|uniref:Uncharacterized protein n=1 Tax=Oculimacula yallundae TaxID=86028 RepID=A0ABR4BTZ6_9HELO